MDIESGQRVTVTATYKPMPDKGRTVWRKAFEVLDIDHRVLPRPRVGIHTAGLPV